MTPFLPVIPSLIIGFLAGLLTFRLKQRWRTSCGAMLTCPHVGCEAGNEATR